MHRHFATLIAALALVAGCTQAQNTGGTQAGNGAPAADDTSRVAITLTDKGYEPASVTVAAGKPVQLTVTRTSSKTCATELVMPAHGINQPLPLGEAVTITFTPASAGELTYACAMDMYKGRVIVQ